MHYETNEIEKIAHTIKESCKIPMVDALHIATKIHYNALYAKANVVESSGVPSALEAIAMCVGASERGAKGTTIVDAIIRIADSIEEASLRVVDEKQATEPKSAEATNATAEKERVKVVSVSMYPSTKDLVLAYMDKQNIRSFSTAIEKIIVDHLGDHLGEGRG